MALAAILIPCLICGASASDSPFVNPPASYLLQVNGKIFREKSPDTRLPPASLTKVMTALVVLEHCSLDEKVTVNRWAAGESGSRIGLHRGDRLTVRALLAATLIASANDACRALAEHVGGSQQSFVTLMNLRARELGLKNTSFRNVCGHDQRGHFSTTHDLMLLANTALGNETFAELVAVQEMKISTISGRRSFHLRNKNRLIGRYEGARGVKTGTTPKAGQCLIALAQRGPTKVLLVIMRSKNRWRVAPAMLDAAFATQDKQNDEIELELEEGIQ